MSRCAGTGRERGQIAKLVNGNIPYRRPHVQFINESWGGSSWFFGFLGVQNLSWPRYLNILGCKSVVEW